MINFARNLLQDITYWAPAAGPDEFGLETFGAPKVIKGRWEDRQVAFVDNQGVEQVSEAVVFLDQDVEPEGYLYLGVSTAPSPLSVDKARKISVFTKTPDIRAAAFERKALLRGR